MSSPEHVIKLLTKKQREENMNTITITRVQEESGTPYDVTYTEAEVLHFLKRTKEIDAVQESYQSITKEIRTIRNAVRDFFSEGEWDNGETVCNKGDVNTLLEQIGSHKLTTKYRGNFTIYGTFELDAEDEDEVDSLVTENLSVDCYAADIDVDSIELHDVEEDN
jgi:hypothetical protein